MNPPPIVNRRRIKRIGAMQLGKLSAVLYGLMGLLFIPIFALSMLTAGSSQSEQAIPFAAIGIVGIFLFPILYAVMGFVIGVIGALLYNLAAKWVGGIEVEVE